MGMKIGSACIALALTTYCVAPAASADLYDPALPVVAENGWKFQVTLDGWLAGIDGDVGIRGLPAADVNITPIDALKDLDGAFAASFQGTGDNWLIYSDFMWAKVSADANFGPSTGNADFAQEQILFTAMVGYKIPVAVENLQVYATAGLRYQHYNVDLSINPAFFPSIDRNGSKDWVDPIIGLSMHYDINDRWFVDGMADIGGFGVSSDFTAQGVATVGYNWTDKISTSIGYRALYTDYQDGGFRYNVTQHGLFTRIALHF